MKHEIVEMNGVRLIGIAKEIPYCKGTEKCPKFWGEYFEKLIKPVVIEGKAPDQQQQAVFDNNIGEYALCTCKVPNHNCMTCGEASFNACGLKGFTYAICGTYQGGPVPEGMHLYPLPDGKWLKIHFEGGMKAFQQQYAEFHSIWLPAHPECRCADNASFMEWYSGNDINSPDYKCGVMMKLKE